MHKSVHFVQQRDPSEEVSVTFIFDTCSQVGKGIIRLMLQHALASCSIRGESGGDKARKKTTNQVAPAVTSNYASALLTGRRENSLRVCQRGRSDSIN